MTLHPHHCRLIGHHLINLIRNSGTEYFSEISGHLKLSVPQVCHLYLKVIAVSTGTNLPLE